MTFLEQSSSDLQLTIAKGNLDLKQFNIISQCKKSFLNFDVTMRIIGGSHFITFKNNHLEFHEIFACHNVRSKEALIYKENFGNIKNKLHLKFSENINYSFESFTLPQEKALEKMCKIEKLVEKIKNENKSLSFEFPASNNETPPKTIIYLELIDAKKISLETIHSYPNENKFVFTQTILNNKSYKFIGGHSL